MDCKRSHINKLFKIVTCALIFVFGLSVNAQLYNKEYVARIYADRESEFYTFTATAENLTPTDVSLRFDFTQYQADGNGNVTKDTHSDRFFLKGNEKKVLSYGTVGYNMEGKITIVLVLYDLDDRPVGQDRIELTSINGLQEIVSEQPQERATNQDQAAPQDGFVLDGLVVENTLTKAGRDFYKYFYAEYYNRQVKTKKNIIIEEVPGKFRSTRISVKIDDQLLWQFFSQPKKSYLQKMANTALDRCIAYLQQLQQQANTITHY